jgi:hypothetical protein
LVHVISPPVMTIVSSITAMQNAGHSRVKTRELWKYSRSFREWRWLDTAIRGQ